MVGESQDEIPEPESLHKVIDKIVGHFHQEEQEQIQTIVEKYSDDQVLKLLKTSIHQKTQSFYVVLEAVLDSTKSFKRCRYIIEVLRELSPMEIQGSISKDILTVLYLNLNLISASSITNLVTYLLDEICQAKGNRMWTELLPRALQILVKEYGSHDITTPDNKIMLGYTFRTNFVDRLINSHGEWKMEILPGIASMIRNGIPLADTERFLFIEKLCLVANRLRPVDLTLYAYHMFRGCTNARQLSGVLFCLDKYLYKHYYAKRIKPLGEPDPTQDSINECPDKMFNENEGNILNHFYHTTECHLYERQVATALKEITYTPRLILTPFVIEALLTITRLNRSSDANKISKSDLLTTIRLAVFNNFYEAEMIKSSIYIKDHLVNFPKTIDLEPILDELLMNSKKGSLDIVIAGVIGLSYSLLHYKKHGEQLYSMAAKFLIKFLKERRLYIKGVLETLLQLMMEFPKSPQYKECIEMITYSKLPITVTDCESLLKRVFEDMPYMIASSALDMMSFIFPLMKLPEAGSIEIRTKFIDTIRRAIRNRNVSMRQMACHGAAMLLKHIKYDRVTAGAPTGFNFTAIAMTGYALINQMTQMRRQAPNPHDMLTLEIMGIFTKCFTEDYQIKKIMYYGLRKAADFNHKVLPHIIDLLIPHFKTFIKTTGTHFGLNCELLVSNEGETIVIQDHLGVLAEVLIHCVIEADKHKVQTEKIYLRGLLNMALDKTTEITLSSLGIVEPINQCQYIIATQFLNFIEALMSYAIWKATSNNGYVMKMIRLFDHYTRCYDDLKKLCTPKTGAKRKREQWTKELKKIESIWDLKTLNYFLQIFYDDNYKDLTTDLITLMKSKTDLKVAVVKASVNCVRSIRQQPGYLQIKHSRAYFEQTIACAKICFIQLKSLIPSSDIYTEETILLSETFKETLVIALNMFVRKFDLFIKTISSSNENGVNKNVFIIISEMIELIKRLCSDLDDATFFDNTKSTRLLALSLQTLDLLLPYIDASSSYASTLYKYFFDICSNYSLHSKSLAIIFKILFNLREKSTQGGDFYITIAVLVARQYGSLRDEINLTKFEMAAISEHTVVDATNYLLLTIKTQLEYNEFLLKKANCLLYRLIKIPGQVYDKQEILRQISEIERMTVNTLTSVCKIMLTMTNATVSLGKVADNIFRDLILFNSNGEKLTKIFMNHWTIVGDDIDYFGLRDLCKHSKPLTRQVGAFILHIEQLSTNAVIDNKMSGKQAAKKVLRDSRFIPKYVLYSEKFSCTIIRMSTKVKEDFKDYLHLGVYRDFKIKSDELRKAINRTAATVNSQSTESTDDFERIDDDEDIIEDEEENEPSTNNSSDEE